MLVTPTYSNRNDKTDDHCLVREGLPKSSHDTSENLHWGKRGASWHVTLLYDEFFCWITSWYHITIFLLYVLHHVFWRGEAVSHRDLRDRLLDYSRSFNIQGIAGLTDLDFCKLLLFLVFITFSNTWNFVIKYKCKNVICNRVLPLCEV